MQNWRRSADNSLFVSSDGAHARLTDPELGTTERFAQLLETSWLPRNQLLPHALRILDGLEQPLVPPAPGRMSSPCGFQLASLARAATSTDDESAVRAYLWPMVDPDGRPLLEPGETYVTSWTGDPPTGGPVREDPATGNVSSKLFDLGDGTTWTDSNGSGEIPPSVEGKAAFTLTDRRLIIVMRPSSGALQAFQGMTMQERLELFPRALAPGADSDLFGAYAKSTALAKASQGTSESAWWSLHVRFEWVSGFYAIEDHVEASEKRFFNPARPERTIAWRRLYVGTPGHPQFAVEVIKFVELNGPKDFQPMITEQLAAVGIRLGERETRLGEGTRTTTRNCHFWPTHGGAGMTIPANLLG